MPSFVMRNSTRALAVGSVCLVCAGCFSNGPAMPKTVPVSGRILYNNQPLAGAEIGFVSKLDNKDIFAARGLTDDSGEFTLSTYLDPQHEVAGATPGDFAVTINKMEKFDKEKMMEEFRNNPSMEGKLKKLVPTKYTVANQSPLKATVAHGEKNRFEFTLED